MAELRAVDETNPVFAIASTTLWDPSQPSATRPLVWTSWLNGQKEPDMVHAPYLYDPYWAMDESGWYETYASFDEHIPVRGRFYLIHDHNKNVRCMTDASGQLHGTYDYAPYGRQTSVTMGLAKVNPWRFSSEYYDRELDLVYFNFRHYNPHDGRWISRDPIAEQGGYNLYNFVNNRPVDRIDLLGLTPMPGPCSNYNDCFKKAAELANAAAKARIDFFKKAYEAAGQDSKIGNTITFYKGFKNHSNDEIMYNAIDYMNGNLENRLKVTGTIDKNNIENVIDIKGSAREYYRSSSFREHGVRICCNLKNGANNYYLSNPGVGRHRTLFPVSIPQCNGKDITVGLLHVQPDDNIPSPEDKGIKTKGHSYNEPFKSNIIKSGNYGFITPSNIPSAIIKYNPNGPGEIYYY